MSRHRLTSATVNAGACNGWTLSSVLGERSTHVPYRMLIGRSGLDLSSCLGWLTLFLQQDPCDPLDRGARRCPPLRGKRTKESRELGPRIPPSAETTSNGRVGEIRPQQTTQRAVSGEGRDPPWSRRPFPSEGLYSIGWGFVASTTTRAHSLVLSRT